MQLQKRKCDNFPQESPSAHLDLNHNSKPMKSSVFQYPYEKVLRRSKNVLAKLGLKITDFDSKKGRIIATTTFSFTRPKVTVNLVVEEMENHNTKVSISGLQISRHFFQKNNDAEWRENEILDALSSVI